MIVVVGVMFIANEKYFQGVKERCTVYKSHDIFLLSKFLWRFGP